MQGYNELDAASNTFHQNTLFGSNSGATIVDALDTLHLMGMKEELAVAKEWVRTHMLLPAVYAAIRLVSGY